MSAPILKPNQFLIDPAEMRFKCVIHRKFVTNKFISHASFGTKERKRKISSTPKIHHKICEYDLPHNPQSPKNKPQGIIQKGFVTVIIIFFFGLETLRSSLC